MINMPNFKMASKMAAV